METVDHHLLGQRVIVRFTHDRIVPGILLEVCIGNWVRVRADDGTVRPGYAVNIDPPIPGVNCVF